MLARLLGGINEALLFQQLAYWSDKGSDPEWIYKTQKDIEEETTLTRTQQETARARLRKLGVIEENKKGLPAKLYFRVNWDAVFALFDDSVKDAGNLQPRMRETDKQERGNDADRIAGFLQPLTKSTYKEDTRDDFSNDSNDKNNIMSREDVEQISWVIRDIAREFADQAPLKSSTTRASRLFESSGLSLDEFLAVVQTARLRTKQYSGSIKALPVDRGGGMPAKPKMAYFFSILDDLLTGENGAQTG